MKVYRSHLKTGLFVRAFIFFSPSPISCRSCRPHSSRALATYRPRTSLPKSLRPLSEHNINSSLCVVDVHVCLVFILEGSVVNVRRYNHH